MKQPIERRLAAILAADVAGYSRLMGADEEGTHDRLKAHLRELVDPKITLTAGAGFGESRCKLRAEINPRRLECRLGRMSWARCRFFPTASAFGT
jgi:class 3 adenylate cyclase